jgi:hypothetical protein
MPRRHLPPDRNNENAYLPTPGEIKAATAAIRATWTKADRRNRLRLGLCQPVVVTEVRMPTVKRDQHRMIDCVEQPPTLQADPAASPSPGYYASPAFARVSSRSVLNSSTGE